MKKGWMDVRQATEWAHGLWVRFQLGREEGQGMVEYGLIIALIAVFLIAALTKLGSGLQETFDKIHDAVTK